MIMYAMLFPIITIPLLGERKNKRYFIEIMHNKVVKREVVDRVYINGKDKLILKDYKRVQTKKNVINIDDLMFENRDKKSFLTMKDVKSVMLNFRDKSKIVRVILFVFVLCIPTGYLLWNIPEVLDMFRNLQKATDIFMYIDFFTLPAILIFELYYISFMTYSCLFKQNTNEVT